MLVFRGQQVSGDVFALIAEAEWDPAAPRDPGRYFVRVAFPDGRVNTRAFPVELPPGRQRFAVYVPAAAPPEPVSFGREGRGHGGRRRLGGAREQHIDRPGSRTSPAPRETPPPTTPPRSAGASLSKEPSRSCPTPGRTGSASRSSPGPPSFYIATTEATVGQVGQRLKGYDPKAGRSDEFALEDPIQPAINLTPAKALEYLKALGDSDPSGVAYRLPTVDEWTLAAKGGKTLGFLVGRRTEVPEGANLLGPEPALAGDATAPSQPPATSPTFKANPFGLAHTFGNAAEWATDPSGGFARMGGHFRTEPASPLPGVKVEKPDELGPDPFVGVRPAFDLSGDSATALIKKRLAADPRLGGVGISFDPARAAVTLTGPVADSSSRPIGRPAPRRALVRRERREPTRGVGAQGEPTGHPRAAGRPGQAGRSPRPDVRRGPPVGPMAGPPPGARVGLVAQHLTCPAAATRPSSSTRPSPVGCRRVVVHVDRQKLASLGLADTSPFQVALSLGTPRCLAARSSGREQHGGRPPHVPGQNSLNIPGAATITMRVLGLSRPVLPPTREVFSPCPTQTGYVLPKPGIPKTLGILNVIFSIILILLGLCMIGMPGRGAGHGPVRREDGQGGPDQGRGAAEGRTEGVR